MDHEGGRVQRFRRDFTRIPSMQVLAQHPSLVEDTAWLMGCELAAAGIDFSFAPVLDADDSFSAVIGDRSFSSDPKTVAMHAESFIRGLHAAGLPAIGKHFPGHGGVAADSHLEMPIDQRSFAQINQTDLLPFYKLKGQLDALMPAHILFPKVDSEFPVGYSKKWLQDILRNEWCFDGVIFSDDLSMEGAGSDGGYEERARLALAAGCDGILMCNNRGALEAVITFLESQATPLRAPRLERMRCRHTWEYSALHQNERWKKTRTRLESIVTSSK